MAGGHGEKLSRKIEQAIAALLVSPNLSMAAEKVGSPREDPLSVAEGQEIQI